MTAILKPVLIYNPIAGKLKRNNQRVLRDVVTALAGAGIVPNQLPTTGANTAGALARDAIASGADLVIGLGGDGTINEIASGMIGSQVPLAILPGGTANVLAIETRTGTNPVKAARRIADYVPRRISIGLLRLPNKEPRYFLAMAGVGLDARVVREVIPGLKKATGKFAYWLAGLKQFSRSLDPVACNGYSSYGFVLASRVRNYGGDLELAGGASLLRDEFEVVSFKGTNPLLYAFYMTGALIRQHARLPGVDVHHASRLDFTRPGAHIQVDGEHAGLTPASVEIVPDALTLLLPCDFRG